MKLLTLIFSLYFCNNVLAQEYVNGASTPFRFNRIEDVYLRFYNGSSTDYFVQFPLSQSSRLLNVVGFQINNPTVFYAHGYLANPEADSVKVVAKAYIETKPGTNFVAIDWSNMAQGDYYTNAAINSRTVGLAAAVKLNSLVNSGVSLSNIHCIGHSLGAQLFGYTGRELKSSYQKTLKRITGLDPAYPNYYPEGPLTLHIKATDAEFVDIIHTDAGGYGAPVSTGTADFWPNNGRSLQPGCSIALTYATSCSHGRSWGYYAESVRTSDAFAASPNDSYLQFTQNTNPSAGMVYMGYSCSTSASGNYYLTTNSASPYGKGLAGLNP